MRVPQEPLDIPKDRIHILVSAVYIVPVFAVSFYILTLEPACVPQYGYHSHNRPALLILPADIAQCSEDILRVLLLERSLNIELFPPLERVGEHGDSVVDVEVSRDMGQVQQYTGGVHGLV